MDDEDLLARVQHRSRLHGRNESRRAICAVVEALGEFLSARAFHLISDLLPDEARRRLRRPEPSTFPAAIPTCRTFLAAVGARLQQDGPDAAFTARVVLEELNATGRVITPGRFAHLVAADLRPLLCATPAPVTADDTNPAPRRVIRVSPAPARPAPSPASRPVTAAPAPAHAASNPAGRPLTATPTPAHAASNAARRPATATPGPARTAAPVRRPAATPAPAAKTLPNAHPAGARPAVVPPVSATATVQRSTSAPSGV